MRRVLLVAGLCIGGLAATPAVASAATYNPRIVGLDVTQGIQRFASHTTPAFVGSRRTARYTGVTLMEGRKTVVKVYADFPETMTTNVSGSTVRLTARETTPNGFVSRAVLFPDVAPGPLGTGPDTVTLAQRRNNRDGVFTFTLPPVATGKPDGDGDGRYENTAPFVVSLLAELIPPADTPKVQTCKTGPCAVDDRLQVDDVTFVSVCCPDVLTVKATASDPRTGTRYTDPRSVVTALDRVVRITPVDIALQDYRATIDITDILRDDIAEFPNGYTRSDGSQSPIPCCFTDGVAARVEMLRAQRFPTATGVFALWSGQLAGGQGRAGAGWTSDNTNRPLTNMGHEFQHSLGRQHYATACGGGSNADPADPDRIGLINGVGTDLSTAPPYTVLTSPDGVPATPGVVPAGSPGVYDLMSYCGPIGGTAESTSRWVSVFGWQFLVNRFRYPSGTAAAATVAQAPAPGIAVYGSHGFDGSVEIEEVVPGTVPAALEPSPFRLVIRDAAGAVLADAPMFEDHPGGHGDVTGTLLAGGAAVPAPNAARVEIVRDGVVVASRARSATAPTAAFTRPRGGARIGRGKRVDIRWRAADADGDRLETTVEWSREGGRPGTWRPVFLGPNGGRVRLPSDYFAGTGHAQLRLRVSDGFNETVVLSQPFRAVSHPPTVEILDPRRGARFSRRARIVVHARAMDERGTVLSGRNVVWRERTRRLGRGDTAALPRLRRGRHTIRVTATDPRNHKNVSARVRLLVR